VAWVGSAVKRVEDPRLLRGRGQYLADIALPRMLHVAFVRSPHAHAIVGRVDIGAARGVPAAVVVTGEDLAARVRPLAPAMDRPGFVATQWPALARGRVQFCGEAVAAVAAPDPYVAADLRDGIDVDYEPLAAVTSVGPALACGQILFRHAHSHGDVDTAIRSAAVVVRETFEHGRVTACPMEPRGLLAAWDGDTLTLWASTQTPQILRGAVAEALGLVESRVRVVVPDVGGGFGLKAHVFPEDLVVAAIARQEGRPARWVEERQENLLAAPQAREQTVELELAADAAGALLAARARFLSDGGAYHLYPTTHALEPMGSAAILPGPYRLPTYAYEVIAVATNKPPLGAYRGVGMTMGVFAMERALDLLGERLGLDPAEIRRRNLIARDEYPFSSSSGLVYDSGDFPAVLQRALEVSGYARLREEQAAARGRGRVVGIGISCFTEWTGQGSEAYRRRGVSTISGVDGASVTMDPDGTVRCITSLPSQGQGHATTLAQVVADRLGIAVERVRVQPVDTHLAPPGTGTMASRGAVVLAGLAHRAADVIERKILALAAHLLEASPDDVVLGGGHASVRGLPDRGVPLAEIARMAWTPPAGGLPGGLEPGLAATVTYDGAAQAFPGAVHVAQVEVDPETGRVAVPRYVVVEDCGTVLNPMIVEGQIHGAVVQGIGEALSEALIYAADGQLTTATLMDYAIPKADDVPPLEIAHLETPSPVTPLGVKGMGEGGTIGAPAAIANAVADAVRHRGVAITALPIRAEQLTAGATATDPRRTP
jgi:carbon-monoxide dehydrogenase large subunit